jgi:hypothetical protein
MRAWHAGLPELDYKPAGPTRAGRYLQLAPAVDSGGAAPATTVPLFPWEQPSPSPYPTLPSDFPNQFVPPTPPATPPTDDQFPPGFPFNDRIPAPSP